MKGFERFTRSGGQVVVISGPSGVGKSTVIDRLLSTAPLKTGAEFSVSHTTRRPRPGEIDGKNYRFVTRDEFEKLINEEFFAEWAEVHGKYYGTPKCEIERITKQGKSVVLELDVQGGRSIKKIFPDALLIFIAVPEDELRRRILGRENGLAPGEQEAEIEKRMRTAETEFQAVGEYDYLVFNEALEKTVDTIHAIIEAERHRVVPG